jgi:putative ABC transport system permease protein
VARLRVGLLAEVLSMAVDTLRTNKMRSALTVLGVVIGVTSIVGMTSLVRGFGKQFENMVRTMGADTVYVAKFSISSFASGKQFWDLMRRPDLTEEDAAAIKLGVPSARHVGIQLGGGPGAQSHQISYRGTNTKSMQILGVTANFPETNYLELPQGRFFNEYEVQRRRKVVVLGASPAEVLFPTTDPIDKRSGSAPKNSPSSACSANGRRCSAATLMSSRSSR